MTSSEPIASAEYTYSAVFEPAEEGGFVVSFPKFPGLVTQGETLAEAREAATDLLTGYLELLRERGRSLPKPDRRRARITEPLSVTLRVA